MAIIRSWSGDGLTPGPMTLSSVGTGDTPFNNFWGAAPQTPPNIVASGPRSPQLEFATASGKSPAIYWNIPAQSVGAGRVYFDTPSAWNSISHSLVEIHTDPSYAIVARITLTGSGTPGAMRLYDGTSPTPVQIATTATNTLTLSTRYRVEWTLDQTASMMVVKLYKGDSMTEVASLSGSGSYGTSRNNVLFGNYSTAATPTINMDDFAISDTAVLIGPKVAPATPTVTVWNGTAEVAATMTVWNGSAEVAIGSRAVQ